MQAHFLPEEARARFAQDRFDAVRRMAELAEGEGCAFAVVAGDVFDSNHVDRQIIARALDALSAFTVPVYLLPGNHDPLDPSSVYLTDAWTEKKPDLITVLTEAVSVPVPGVDGIEVVGLPWRSKHQLGDPAAECYGAEASASGALRVVIAHGVVDELSPDVANPSLIDSAMLRNALASGDAHYVALGDRHSVTEIPDTQARAYYSGTPVATGYGEIEPNQVLMVGLDDHACIVERRELGGWAFHRQTRDLNSEDDVSALSDLLDSHPAKPTTVIRLALRGTLNLSTDARLDAVLEENRLKFASLNTWEAQTDLLVEPDEADLAELDVSGYVRETLDALSAEAAGSGEEAVVARDALNLLYRLAQ